MKYNTENVWSDVKIVTMDKAELLRPLSHKLYKSEIIIFYNTNVYFYYISSGRLFYHLFYQCWG